MLMPDCLLFYKEFSILRVSVLQGDIGMEGPRGGVGLLGERVSKQTFAWLENA